MRVGVIVWFGWGGVVSGCRLKPRLLLFDFILQFWITYLYSPRFDTDSDFKLAFSFSSSTRIKVDNGDAQRNRQQLPCLKTVSAIDAKLSETEIK
jgi:hypothetical protein